MNTKRKYTKKNKSIRKRKYTKKNKKNIRKRKYTKKNKKNIRKRKYTKKNKNIFLQKGGIRPETITAARELIDRIDNFFKDCNIGIEYYLIPEPGNDLSDDPRNYHRKIYLYINNPEDNSKEYFYQTTFKIINYDSEDEQYLESWSDLDKEILREGPHVYELYIITTLCILNGYSFAVIVQGYIMCKCLLKDIIFAKKEDMTDAASNNSVRNFNHILGFYPGEHIQLINSEDNEDLTKYLEKRQDEEKLKWDKAEDDIPLAAKAEDDEEHVSDYNPSSPGSEPFSDYEKEEISLNTTDSTKYALLPKVIPQLNDILNDIFFTEKKEKFTSLTGKRKQDKLEDFLGERVKIISQNRQKLQEQSTGWTFDDPSSGWQSVNSEDLFNLPH